MDAPAHGAPATPRRAILRLLAAAPAVLAGCASLRPAAGRAPQAVGPASAAPPPPADPLAAIRAVRLPAEAEPALVFRAVAARPGGAP